MTMATQLPQQQQQQLHPQPHHTTTASAIDTELATEQQPLEFGPTTTDVAVDETTTIPHSTYRQRRRE
jgi:hypothetical protein